VPPAQEEFVTPSATTLTSSPALTVAGTVTVMVDPACEGVTVVQLEPEPSVPSYA
jgi:hypothetical protein